jgi:O-acetyl-ADP-ribose deacetylase (regulator of RNase III)
MEECRRIGGCPTGKAVLTTAGKLPAKNVIHAVGPIYRHREADADLLQSTYRSSLVLAKENGLKSLAFPSISTGAYGYPIREAASIAIKTVVEFLRDNPEIHLVRFTLFSRADYEAYADALEALS